MNPDKMSELLRLRKELDPDAPDMVAIPNLEDDPAWIALGADGYRPEEARPDPDVDPAKNYSMAVVAACYLSAAIVILLAGGGCGLGLAVWIYRLLAGG